jgi:hypothetical protein
MMAKKKADEKSLKTKNSRDDVDREFEFDMKSVKINPPLVEEFMEKTKKEDKERRDKVLRDLVD